MPGTYSEQLEFPKVIGNTFINEPLSPYLSYANKMAQDGAGHSSNHGLRGLGLSVDLCQGEEEDWRSANHMANESSCLPNETSLKTLDTSTLWRFLVGE